MTVIVINVYYNGFYDLAHNYKLQALHLLLLNFLNLEVINLAFKVHRLQVAGVVRQCISNPVCFNELEGECVNLSRTVPCSNIWFLQLKNGIILWKEKYHIH